MITEKLLELFDVLRFGALSLIPTLETPSWIIDNLPNILKNIMAFNYYLPLYELIVTVVSVLTITFMWKLVKIVLRFFQVDLNA